MRQSLLHSFALRDRRVLFVTLLFVMQKRSAPTLSDNGSFYTQRGGFLSGKVSFHLDIFRSSQICQADETKRTCPLRLPTPDWAVGATFQSLASAYSTFARSSRMLPSLLLCRETCRQEQWLSLLSRDSLLKITLGLIIHSH